MKPNYRFVFWVQAFTMVVVSVALLLLKRYEIEEPLVLGYLTLLVLVILLASFVVGQLRWSVVYVVTSLVLVVFIAERFIAGNDTWLIAPLAVVLVGLSVEYARQKKNCLADESWLLFSVQIMNLIFFYFTVYYLLEMSLSPEMSLSAVWEVYLTSPSPLFLVLGVVYIVIASFLIVENNI